MHVRLSRTRLLGFTLLELIVTIVVLGLLAALAVPAFSAVVDRSKDEVLAAEVEALGRGIAALAAFDGGGVTDAHVEEFLAAETAATALVSTGRWDLYADADAPASPADGDLLFAAEAGYVGLATAAAHRDGRAVYAVVGTGGAVVQLTDATDANADGAGYRGADALCFYGLVGCTADADAEPLPSTGGASGGGTELAAVPVSDTFTRPDGGLAGTVTEEGDLTWQPFGTYATPSISSQRVVASGWAYALVDTRASDGTLEVVGTFAHDYNQVGLAFRSDGTDNTWDLYVTQAGQWGLRKRGSVNGTVIQGSTGVRFPSSVTVQLQMTGPKLRLSVNGTLLGEVDDPYLQDATAHGLFLYRETGTPSLDNFTFTPAG